MPYQTFDFPFHYPTHRYPAGDQVRFGNGYTHAAKPDVPVQREFTLVFNTMVHVLNPYTQRWLRLADTSTDSDRNTVLRDLKRRSIDCLDDFYADHMLYKRFYYDHYLFGRLVVRFAEPFQMPVVQESVRGIYNNIPVQGFELRITEHPE